jgi:hypothetical protein
VRAAPAELMIQQMAVYPKEFKRAGENMRKANAVILKCACVVALSCIFNEEALAACTGCRSGHGGVVCSGGVTKCGDGTDLSATCVAKGCNVCMSPPGKATLISPIGTISTTTPAFLWNAVSGATWYLLWVNSTAGSGVINSWYSAEQANCASGTGSCSVTPATPVAAGNAQWWIQTWSEAGYGPWSDGMSFSVDVGGPPPKASLISPSGTITTSTPTYTWNAVATSTWYLLYVNDSKTQATINQWYKASDTGCGSGSGTCSVAPSTVLAPGDCQWWIQTWNDSGTGPWSDGMMFKVQEGGPPGKATLVSPNGNISTTSPTYTWNAISTASWYLLYVNDSKTQGKINQWYKAVDAGCSVGTGKCFVTPSTSLTSGSCQWWIQTYNDSGYGPWSDAMAFTAPSSDSPPGKATLVSPSGNIATATPTYKWNAVETAGGYILFVNDSKNQGKINQSLKAADAGCSSEAGTCSYTPSTILAAGACQWWIQAYNDFGSGPWSDVMIFTVGGSITGPYGIEFVTVAAGEFQMGSTNGYSWEQPVHRVIISKSFQLGKYEITQGQWKVIMGSNPSYFKGDDNLPVEQVSWDDAQAFMAKLNALNDGYRYRLPTEAEWEYACRAGTTGDYGGTGNLDEMGWYNNNSGSKTHAVGTKKANTWGLHDMHGNVWEWVQDWYSSDYYSSSPLTDPPGPTSGSGRVGRGGGWGSGAGGCRSAVRNAGSPGGTYDFLGFRLLRTAQ